MHIGTYIVHSTYAHPKFTQKCLFRCISLWLKTKIQVPNFYFFVAIHKRTSCLQGVFNNNKNQNKKKLYFVFGFQSPEGNEVNIGTKIVFCYQNCSELLWEKIVLVMEKTFEIWNWRPRICEILRSLEQFIQTVKGQNNFW